MEVVYDADSWAPVSLFEKFIIALSCFSLVVCLGRMAVVGPRGAVCLEDPTPRSTSRQPSECGGKDE